ncbi:CD209 antigen-like [Sardina pilchardus]|uniref:CD209 antigen-like n=1 Tax=Sardina pilchardus TaxID=27697 RepID=UPI002E142249
MGNTEGEDKDEKNFCQNCKESTENQITEANVGWNRQSVYCAVGVCVGLLCLLQATLNITLRLHYMMQNNKAHEELELLFSNYTNLIEDTDDLLMNYTDLIEERDLLLTNYTDLVDETDQLLTNNTDLVEDRDLCLARYRNLTTDKKKLQISYNNLAKDKNKLMTSYNTLAKKKNQLLTSYNNMVEKRERLLNMYAGWTHFQSSLYFFSDEKKNWGESRRECQQMGGDLVIINNQDEQNFVKIHQSDNWIGLNDINKEREWRWVDGTLLTHGFWHPGEPNNLGDEDCVHFLHTNLWNDVPCMLEKKWICEKRI